MHQIRFRLGLRPRSRWGSLQHSPDPLLDLGGHFAAGGGAGLRKRRGRGGKGEGGEVEGGKGRAHKVTVEPGHLRALLCHCL